MRMLTLLCFTTTVVLSLSSCATTIKDFQTCSPIPPITDPTTGVVTRLGATCDDFLVPNQQILDEASWQALQALWMKQGFAVECTNSDAIGTVKAEIEKLCSKTPCDYQTLQIILGGLVRIMDLGALK